jgi:hypothetical protein
MVCKTPASSRYLTLVTDISGGIGRVIISGKQSRLRRNDCDMIARPVNDSADKVADVIKADKSVSSSVLSIRSQSFASCKDTGSIGTSAV